jgi:hypothetical protein
MTDMLVGAVTVTAQLMPLMTGVLAGHESVVVVGAGLTGKPTAADVLVALLVSPV